MRGRYFRNFVSLSPIRYQVCIGQMEDRKFFRRLSLGCVVFDEAHMLKNMTTQRYAHLMRIKVGRGGEKRRGKGGKRERLV